MTDPFRPHPPAFPRARLLRAGVEEGTVASIAEQYEGLSYAERVELNRYVNARTDAAIRERFAAPLTRETLDDLTVDELESRIREWNRTHDDEGQHLAVSGRKADLVDRLVEAYGIDQQQTPTGLPTTGEEQPTGGTAATVDPDAAAVPVPVPPSTPAPADVTVPTAPTATATDGSPATPDAAGVGSITTERTTRA